MARPNDLEIYDSFADNWWREDTRWIRTLSNMVPARLRYFDPIIRDWRGKQVLDLGCAGGFMAEAIARKGATVAGLDPAEKAIEAARAHAAAEGLEIDYRVGVGEALPWPDASLDAVVCVDVLEHVEDLEKVVQEVARVLKPGGVFLYDTINATWVASLVVVTMAERVLGLLPRGAHDPSLFIKPATLRELMEAQGFSVGPIKGLGPTGVNRRGDFTFGAQPVSWVIYMGSATKS